MKKKSRFLILLVIMLAGFTFQTQAQTDVVPTSNERAPFFISVSPNPTSGDATIYCSHVILNIHLYQADGKELEVWNEKQINNARTYTINVSKFQPGLYLLKVNAVDNTWSGKLTIK